MKISASQLETAQTCIRKWKFQYGLRLPTAARDHFAFGSVLHAVLERFLNDQELYPEGWDTDPDSQKRLDPSDSVLIQHLVEAGISAGYVERRPGGVAEYDFQMPIGDVTYVGYQDYRTPARVEDHKTSKSERYLKGPKALKKSIQMMLYGKELVESGKKKGRVPPIIELVHNQFLKTPKVKQAVAEVTPQEIEDFFQEVIVPLTRAILDAKKVEDPFALPDPPAESCNTYGGCPFLTLCSRQETIPAYKMRISRLNNPDAFKPVTMTSPSDFLARRKAQMNSAPAVNPPKPAASAPEPQPEVEQPEPAATGYATPPWAAKDCPACSKTEFPGFSMKTGKPCRICPMKSGIASTGYSFEIRDGVPLWWREGETHPVVGPTPDKVEVGGSRRMYTVNDLLNGLRSAKSVGELDEVLAAGQQQEVGTEEDEPIIAGVYAARFEDLSKSAAKPAPAPAAEPAPAPAPAAEPAPAPAAEPAPAPAPAAEPTPEKPKKARAKKAEPEPEPEPEPAPTLRGFILAVGSVPVRAPHSYRVVLAEDILHGVHGYWANQQVFERRQKLREAIGETAQALDGCIVVQQGRDPDVDNLISSLIPHASLVFRATSL